MKELFRAALIGLVLLVSIWLLLNHPQTPLPSAWNPQQPFRFDEKTPLTRWKLERAVQSPARCLAALNNVVQAEVLADKVTSPVCYIRPRIRVSRLKGVDLGALESNCATALRLAAWITYGLQPAAAEIYQNRLTGIQHLGSYNCRKIRGSDQMSTHATADAIDIKSFALETGQIIDVQAGWAGDKPDALFLRRARDSACKWFKTTLGPAFNAAHADHFHLQNTGWGTCR